MPYDPAQFMTGGPEAFGLPGEAGGAPAAAGAAAALTPTDPAAPFAMRCPLAAPIRTGEAEIAAVTLRPLTLGETEAMTRDGALPRFAVLSAMSGLPADALARLSWPDAELVLMRAGRMLPDVLRERLIDGAAGEG